MALLGVLALVVLSVVGLVVIYKAVAVVWHVKYLFYEGPALRRALDAKRSAWLSTPSAPPAQDRDVLDVLRTVDGDKLMFVGFKEYRLRAWAESKRALPRRRSRLVGRAVQFAVLLFDFVVLELGAGIVLVLAGFISGVPGYLPIQIIGSIVAVALSVIVSTIALEATVSYFRLASYGLAFQNPKAFISGRDRNGLIIEILAIVGMAAACIYTDGIILSFLATVGIEQLGEDDLAGPSGIFNCFYTSFMTFIFSTPVSPTSVLGRAIVMLVSIQGLAALVLAITAFGSAKVDN